jgi:hypothetical protein
MPQGLLVAACLPPGLESWKYSNRVRVLQVVCRPKKSTGAGLLPVADPPVAGSGARTDSRLQTSFVELHAKDFPSGLSSPNLPCRFPFDDLKEIQELIKQERHRRDSFPHESSPHFRGFAQNG